MTAQERESLLERIAAHAEDVPEIQTALTACRAVGPENGGHGEGAKAGLIEKWLRDMGISGIEHVDAPDGRVPGGKRPNLIATIPGDVIGGITFLLYGMIGTSGLRILVDKKVDYSKNKNLILTSVVFVAGLSGLSISLGAITITGMTLAAVTAVIISLIFYLLDKAKLMND